MCAFFGKFSKSYEREIFIEDCFSPLYWSNYFLRAIIIVMIVICLCVCLYVCMYELGELRALLIFSYMEC